MLKQTLQRVESEGRPALVTVLGNAGVGKSRIAWEFAKYVEGCRRPCTGGGAARSRTGTSRTPRSRRR